MEQRSRNKSSFILMTVFRAHDVLEQALRLSDNTRNIQKGKYVTDDTQLLNVNLKYPIAIFGHR